MNTTRAYGVPDSQPAVHTSVQPDTHAPRITLRLSVDEGRWLVTAVGIALRLLEGLHLRGPEAQRYQIHGLAALHRIANQLPSGLSGYYPSSSDFKEAQPAREQVGSRELVDGNRSPSTLRN